MLTLFVDKPKQSSLMKTLIVYYSFSGNNELLAKKLQALLNCQIVKISEPKRRTGLTIMLDLLFKRNPKIGPVNLLVSEYDHLIFIAPIWAGRIATPLKVFIKSLDKNITNYSFISLCGGSDNRKVLSELVYLTGKKPLKLLEVTVNDLLPAGTAIKQTSFYKVKEEDLLRIEDILHHFIRQTVPVIAPSAKTKN